MIQARFDDLRPAHRRSFALRSPLTVLSTTQLQEVMQVIARAEAAVAEGRWVAGWVAYEAAAAFDGALHTHSLGGTPFQGLPLAWFAVFESRGPAAPTTGGDYALGDWQPTIDELRHAGAVDSIREHIRQGRTYQVNHTFRLSARFSGSIEGFYHDVSHSQSAGYGALISTDDWAVVSASPELFFEWHDGWVTSRPMKGTTRRGIDLADDEERRRWLADSEKNQAENLMIVDMVRNDLGRIALTGTVEVPALFSTERYDTVWQLTSTVSARTHPSTGLADVFSALFPCASITGAPKVAATEIIESLEVDPRGVYCGAVGFGGPASDGAPMWAFNVAIRTVLVDRRRNLAWYGTGGGITYDSTPKDEYQEALLKARVLERRTADFRLLETMLWTPGVGVGMLDRHLDRIEESARYFDIPFDRGAVRSVVESAGGGRERLRLRLLVDRAGSPTVEISPFEPGTSRPRLAVDDVGVDPMDPFLHHKTTERRVYEEAATRHPGADDVVLVNGNGRITETTIANIAVLIDGEWRTPPTTAGCLAGIHRAELLEQGAIIERDVTVDELRAAESIARFNALRPWEECDLT